MICIGILGIKDVIRDEVSMLYLFEIYNRSLKQFEDARMQEFVLEWLLATIQLQQLLLLKSVEFSKSKPKDASSKANNLREELVGSLEKLIQRILKRYYKSILEIKLRLIR